MLCSETAVLYLNLPIKQVSSCINRPSVYIFSPSLLLCSLRVQIQSPLQSNAHYNLMPTTIHFASPLQREHNSNIALFGHGSNQLHPVFYILYAMLSDRLKSGVETKAASKASCILRMGIHVRIVVDGGSQSVCILDIFRCSMNAESRRAEQGRAGEESSRTHLAGSHCY
jgi:hypothetical protein